MKKLILLLLLLPVLVGGDGLYISNPFYVAAIHRTTGVVDGPNVWYDVETSANGDTGEGVTDTSYFVSAVTVGQGGSATKIRVYIFGNIGGTHNIKVALYSNAGSKLGQGTTTVDGADDGVYKEVTLDTPVTVTATTYKIAVAGDHSDLFFYYKAGTGAQDIMTLAYASFPEDPLGTPTFDDLARNFVVGVYVD